MMVNRMAQTRKLNKKKIAPKVVLAFVAKNREYLPTVENYGDFTVEEEIYRVRLILWHTKITHDRYVKMAKEQKIPTISETVLKRLFKESTQKKYRERESPPFSANDLCGSTLSGYTSVKNKAGVCTWSLSN